MFFNRFLGSAATAVLVLSGLCLSAFTAGAATYTYAGNSFTTITDDPTTPAGAYTTAMNVSGSFTVAGTLAPNLDANIAPSVLSVSFTDGRNVLDDVSQIVAFGVQTDALGAITGWNVVLQLIEGFDVGDQHFTIETRSVPALTRDLGRFFECTSEFSALRCRGGQDRGEVLNSPGTWSIVPEPSTAFLMGLGLTGLASVRRRC